MIDFTKLSDPDSEVVLLGTMLSSINAVNNAMDVLGEGDFVKAEHVKIFRAMQKLYRLDHEIEPFSVIRVVEEDNKNFDGFYVINLQQFNTSGEGLYQIEKIKELSRMRRLLVAFHENCDIVQNKKGTSEEIIAKICKDMDSIVSEKSAPEKNYDDVIWQNFRDTGEPYWKYLEKRMEMSLRGEIVFDGVSTHYPRLDKALNGLNNGHFIVVGARPGVGKTTFLINLIRNVCLKQKQPAAFFSLEMSTEDVFINLTCIDAAVPSKSVRAATIEPDEFNRFIGAAEKLRGVPLYVDDQGSLRISQIIARAKRYVSVYGIKVIFVDYLTLVTGDVRYSNKQEEIAETSKALRALAKKLNIPIICICQLNRDSEKDQRIPRKSDLRESGQIEQDAHSILMLHRPDMNDPLGKPGLMQVHIVKNRFGEECVIDFSFQKESGLMEEIAPIQYFHPPVEDYQSPEFDRYNV